MKIGPDNQRDNDTPRVKRARKIVAYIRLLYFLVAFGTLAYAFLHAHK